MCLSDRNFGHRIFGKIRAVLLRFALAMLFSACGSCLFPAVHFLLQQKAGSFLNKKHLMCFAGKKFL